MAKRNCSVADCGSLHFCKGFCRKHYERWMRHGDPNKVLKKLAPRGATMAWLHEHADHQGDDCLIWPFARFPDGRAHMNGDKPTRIMCRLAHGPAPSLAHEAAHSCGKGHDACVNPRHLRWATPLENAADKEIHGTQVRGEAHPGAKLSPADVLQIRELASSITQKEIARRYSLGTAVINRIVRGLAWRHV